MNRREFIAAIGGVAVWPMTARAGTSSLPVVGFLSSTSPDTFAHLAAAFRSGLSEGGYVDAENVTIAYRWAQGKLERLPKLVSELIDSSPVVIAALGGDVTALAAKAATSTVPIVFLNGSDPIKAGLVASVSRPGGNVTGVSLFARDVQAKRLELLHALVPEAKTIAVLNNGLVAESEHRSRDLKELARTLGVKLVLLDVTTEDELGAAFATMTERGAQALFVSGSPFFTSRRHRLVSLAADHRIPAIYAWRELVDAGGLISYGASQSDSYRQAGLYSARILKGARPADLPVLQPSMFDLVINMGAAKALGLDIPTTLLALADDVVE